MSRPTSPDDVTLAPSSSLASRGVQGDPSIKISDRTIQFKGQRIRNIQSNVPVPIADYALPPLPTYSSTTPPMFCATCPQTTWYFECTVIDQPRGPASLVCVGLATADLPGYVLGPGMEMSGRSNVGVGYHSTGRKYVNGEYVAQYGKAFGVGDTIGVGWDPMADIVFFALNGKVLGTAAAECMQQAATAVTTPLPMFPTFGGTRGAVLSVNFGTESFAWEPANRQTLGFFMDPLPKYSLTCDSQTHPALHGGIPGPRECALQSTVGPVACGDVNEMDLSDRVTDLEMPMYGGWADPPAY